MASVDAWGRPAPLFPGRLLPNGRAATARIPAPTPRGSIRTRLLTAFTCVLMVALTGSAIGVWALREVASATDTLVQQAVAYERMAADAYRTVSVDAASYRAFALSSEPEVGDALTADIARARPGYDALMRQLGAGLRAPEDRARLAAIATAEQSFQAAVQELVRVRGFGVTENIRKVYTGRFTPALQQLLDAVAALQQSERERIDTTAARVEALSSMARTALVAFGLVSFIIGVLVSLRLVGNIARPIQQAVDTSGRVAEFDLTTDIEGHDRDETGRLLGSLGSMQEALRALVGQVRDAAQNISGASSEIAHGNDNLSHRTESMASGLQRTAASMGDMSQTIQQAAHAAQQADALAGSASEAATRGSEVTARVLATMRQLEQSSRRVVDIVGVIESIAFQTNILALNAAVESARAGEQGRGFAVVAAEVRSLANRSAQAAKDIQALIRESTVQVGLAAGLAEDAGRSMGDIHQAVQSVTAIVADIAVRARTQSEGTARLDAEMGQLDLTTQQNAALVEESAAAAESLAFQARELTRLVHRFQLADALPD
jgi:methyl-accepting chemotaxis protein